MKLYKCLLLTCLFLFTFFTSSMMAFARSGEYNFENESTGEVKADVSVNALVGSKICLQYSSTTSNLPEILADLSQRALFTIKVYDCSNQPMKDMKVVISSNRGQIDRLSALSAEGAIIPPVGLLVQATTDENGFAFFEARSEVPGEAVFSFLADTIVNLESVKVTFLPLPFPEDITITVDVPKFLAPIIAPKTGKITLFEPAETKTDEKKLVNLGVELKIPFLFFCITVFLITIVPILFIIIIINAIKIRKMQKRETTLLEREIQNQEKEEGMIESLMNRRQE